MFLQHTSSGVSRVYFLSARGLASFFRSCLWQIWILATGPEQSLFTLPNLRCAEQTDWKIYRPMADPLPICASCAEQAGATLCCARCHTIYCSRACQKTHWASGGHKKACKGLARARRDTDLAAQSRTLARVSHMSGGAADDAHCLFCLDGGDATDPLLRGCACRGTSGWSHAACLVKPAEAARAPPPPEPHFAPWTFCSTCKQRFTGLVRMRLAIALWATWAVHAMETDDKRLVAADESTPRLSALQGSAQMLYDCSVTSWTSTRGRWGPSIWRR